MPIAAAEPLLSEWVVICDSPAFSACVAAVELPDATQRPFEVLWSTEPAIVRDAARTAASIASAQRPELEQLLRQRLQAPAPTGYDSVRATTALTNRIVAYVAAPETIADATLAVSAGSGAWVGTRGSSAPGRDRTCGLRFRKPLLYPLSYGSGTGAKVGECVLTQLPA